MIAWLRIERLWLKILLVNVFAFVAVGSKEGAIALPVILTAIVWLRDGGRFDVRPGLACAPAYLIWFALRRAALGDQPTFGEFFTDQSVMVRLYTLGELLAHNIRLLFIPTVMRADYTSPTTTMLASPTVLSVVGWGITLAIMGWFVIAVRRKHWSALGIGMTVAGIWPFLHLVIPLGIPLAERWLYLSSAGISILLGQALWRIRGSLKPIVHRSLVAALLFCFVALTTLRAAEWETPLRLWEADASKSEASAFTWGNYSLSLWGVGRHSDALKAMMHARNLKPDWTVYDVKYKEMRSMLRVEPSSATPLPDGPALEK